MIAERRIESTTLLDVNGDTVGCTIVKARYGGVYSGAQFHVWPKLRKNIPHQAYDDDVTCSSFWANYTGIVGKGSTPEKAISDLKTWLT